MTLSEFAIFGIILGLVIVALAIVSFKAKDRMTFIFALFLLGIFIFTSVRFKIDNLSAPEEETPDPNTPTYICGIE